MTSKKDMLAALIFSLKDASPEDQLSKLQHFAVDSRFPKYEVRTVGPKGSLLIKVPDREWIKPMEWAINHRNTIERKMKEDLERVLSLGSRPELKNLGYVRITKSTASEVIPKLIVEADVRNLSAAGYYSYEQISTVFRSVVDHHARNSCADDAFKERYLSILSEVLAEIKSSNN